MARRCRCASRLISMSDIFLADIAESISFSCCAASISNERLRWGMAESSGDDVARGHRGRVSARVYANRGSYPRCGRHKEGQVYLVNQLGDVDPVRVLELEQGEECRGMDRLVIDCGKVVFLLQPLGQPVLRLVKWEVTF